LTAERSTRSVYGFSGVVPTLTAKADNIPIRTESGIGALMPWANRLWAISYVSSGARSGAGTGLWEIHDDLTMTKHPASVVGTYANRMIHKASNQLII